MTKDSCVSMCAVAKLLCVDRLTFRLYGRRSWPFGAVTIGLCGVFVVREPL